MTQGATTVVVLGTGGTIAGSAASPGDGVGYRAGSVGVAELVRAAAPRGVSVEAEQIAQVDSKDMSAAVWRSLVDRVGHHLSRAEVRGVVVTHGTDTLEETAWLLARSVDARRKPVVLTGAMRPATSRSADGPRNLVDAVAVATAGARHGAHGVVAVLAGSIHAARDVRKAHPYRVDAFTSGDAGPVGYLEEGTLRLLRAWPEVEAGMRLPDADDRWPRVEIVVSGAAVDGRIVGLLAGDGVAGIVVVTTGNGGIHRDMEACLIAAQARGVSVLRCLRGSGGTIVERDDTEPRSPFASAGELTPGKARVELMLRLASR